MVHNPKRKKGSKLPKDVRELTTEETADKLFGKRAANELRKVAQDKELAKRKKG
jgi:hypothetical protein